MTASVSKTVLLSVLITVFLLVKCSFAAKPFEDAVSVWHFDGVSDAQESPESDVSRLVPVNAAEVGIPMSQTDARQSALRGCTDGKMAVVKRGGFLKIENKNAQKLNIPGRQISIYLRLKSPSGTWGFPLFSRYGGHENLSYNLFSFPDFIGLEVGTTGNRGLMAGRAYFSEMRRPETARTEWHDIIAVVNGVKMELYVDGRCCDEEFMVGDLRPNDRFEPAFCAETTVAGIHDNSAVLPENAEVLFDTAAVWNRALTQEEIAFLSGGDEFRDARTRVEPLINRSLQYWKPSISYGVGDCMPFFHDGRFQFVYLLDKGHHTAKNGLGAHQWIQATSEDLINWTHHEYVLPITHQWEGSICTGSLFHHDNLWYAFYATRAYPGVAAPDGKTYAGEFVAYATSTDGIHFVKQEPNPLVVLPSEAGYSRAGRDPVVFQDPADGLFHMYITSNYKGQGCWAHLSSKDLKSWTLLDPVLAGGRDPECPDWFQWGDQFYLIVNWGNGYYRMSKQATGPWINPTGSQILMPGIVRVPKTAPFKDGRRIICGWTSEHGFGGHAVFHELVRRADGTLGEKFVPEMIPQTENPIVEIAEISGEKQSFDKLPGDLRFQAELTFDPNTVGNVVAPMPDWKLEFEPGQYLVLSPQNRTVTIKNTVLTDVDFSSGSMKIDLIISDDLIDICLNSDRTVTQVLKQEIKRSLTIVSPQSYKTGRITISPLSAN